MARLASFNMDSLLADLGSCLLGGLLCLSSVSLLGFR